MKRSVTTTVVIAMVASWIAVMAVAAISLNLSYSSNQALRLLLLNGKTASAISSHKTAVLAQEIETLLIQYHQQSVTALKQQEQGQKQLPILLGQIEAAIAGKDNRSIHVAVMEAVTEVEHYFINAGKVKS